MQRTLLRAALAAMMALLVGSPALANRCGDQNPPHCGVDSDGDPAGACTDASMTQLPVFKHSGACRPGDTMVVYDVGAPFPDNGIPADAPVAGEKSFVIIHAGDASPCAHMVDTVPPLPCPDPALCPDPNAPQPAGAVKVPITGYIVGCWSKPDHKGCRDLALYTKSVCLHLGHELLGPGCGMIDGIDCSQVSTEQVAIDVPGAKNRRLCPPSDPENSCRAIHGTQPGVRFWIGGFCSTQNCAGPGTDHPAVDGDTCKTSWGATMLGYNTPAGKGLNQPGWFDWKTGSFKVDVSSPKPTCGPLGRCLGEHTGELWDLQLVAVPRPGQPAICLGDGSACDACNEPNSPEPNSPEPNSP